MMMRLTTIYGIQVILTELIFTEEVIENMPLLEATPDENQIMRYKLVTLPKNTAKLPIMELPSSNLTFNELISQTITPNTRNGSDVTLGYTFVLHNQDFLI